MKRVFTLAAVFVLFTCSLFALELDPSVFKKDLPSVELQNHSFLSQENVGSQITITGVLSVNKGVFSLKENADSRSAVTFVLEVKGNLMRYKLKKRNGKTVTVTGTLTEATSTWTKKMKVQKID